MKLSASGFMWTPRAGQMLGKQRELQKHVDQTIIRHMEPYVPKRSGTLSKSVIRGSVIGSGILVFAVPYARKQYHWKNRRYVKGKRDSYWFLRMKKEKIDVLNREIKAQARRLYRE